MKLYIQSVMYQQIIRKVVSLKQSPIAARFFCSNANKLINVEVNDKTGIALVSLNRPPVNSLNIALMRALQSTIEDLESNRTKGLIISTTSKTVFCAGLDIMDMYQKSDSHLSEIWISLQDLWMKLFSTHMPTVAAISGHAPAGGCMLSLACDYRIICPGYKIGLNETWLGIVAPEWLMDTMKHVLPSRIAEAALLEGKLFTSEEAIKVGLVDEFASDKDDALTKATAYITKFQRISPDAYGFTKQTSRKKILQRFEENRDDDVKFFVSNMQKPESQKNLDSYIQSLKNKKKR